LAAASAAQKKANKNAAAAVTDYTAKRMAPMIKTLAAKKSRGAQSGTDAVPVALTKAPEIVSETNDLLKPTMQPTITAAFQNRPQSSLAQSNYAALEMSVANFFHACNIPDAAVESPQFAYMLNRARFVDSNFKIPGRKKIGGELLDLNHKATMDHIKKQLGKEAPTFGIGWMSDGATVNRMPLLNVLAITAGVSPMTCAIIDATDQIKDGGKRDASYIAHYMEEVVSSFDPTKEMTDVFYFDDLAKLAPIKVSTNWKYKN
jgi:hypothetical protein